VASARALVTGLTLVTAVVAVTPARACPSCPAGRQARSEVWNDDFGFNLLVALLPFLVVGAICARAEAIGRPARRSRGPGARST
jgi:hypothetical protein